MVVLHDLDGFLLVVDDQPVCGRKAERLLANVCAPPGDAAADGVELGVQPASGGLAGVGRARFCGHLLGRRQADQIRQIPKAVRLHICLLHRRVDLHAIGLVS